MQLRKLWILELFLESLLCWERKSVRYETNNPQAVMVINLIVLWFFLWFDWSLNHRDSRRLLLILVIFLFSIGTIH